MSIWYLASPYSKYPDGTDRACELVCMRAGRLMIDGYTIFCPIAHSHAIAKVADLPTYFEWWRKQDQEFLSVCKGLFVYMMPGWRDSVGVTWEIDYMNKAKKPITYLPWEGVDA